jgi:hypothetical protein
VKERERESEREKRERECVYVLNRDGGGIVEQIIELQIRKN